MLTVTDDEIVTRVKVKKYTFSCNKCNKIVETKTVALDKIFLDTEYDTKRAVYDNDVDDNRCMSVLCDECYADFLKEKDRFTRAILHKFGFKYFETNENTGERTYKSIK